MFGLNLTNHGAETRGQAQKQFNTELRKLIRRYSGVLEAGGGAAGKSKRSRTVLAKFNLHRSSYLVIRSPRKDAPLPSQQRKIALLVVQGLTNKEIANRLKIKASTVTAHLAKIYLRLDIHSRVALARHFILSR
jgi:DNA-binding NarL/FixJ family response regulator